MKQENGEKKKKNGWNGKGQRFGYEKPAIPGPGRPRLTDAVRIARELLKEAAPEMVDKIIELTKSSDEDIAIKAIKVGLDKILPNLEDIETHDDRPLPEFHQSDLTARLNLIRTGNKRSSGSSDPEGTPVAI